MFQVFDSSEKFPRDILSDYSDNMGNFDQCLSVSSKQFDVYDAYALASVQFRPSANRSDNVRIMFKTHSCPVFFVYYLYI